jgi:hypothetical protein
VGWLRAEGDIPVRIKSAYLADEQIYDLVDYAAWLRTSSRTRTDPSGSQDRSERPQDVPVAGSVVVS